MYIHTYAHTYLQMCPWSVLVGREKSFNLILVVLICYVVVISARSVESNKCCDRSMGSQTWNYKRRTDRPTNRTTDRQTDRHGHREVSFSTRTKSCHREQAPRHAIKRQEPYHANCHRETRTISCQRETRTTSWKFSKIFSNIQLLWF